MRRWRQILDIILGVLVGLIVVALVAVFLISNQKLGRTYQIADAPLAIPSDAASIERGRHLVTSVIGCGGCHGEKPGRSRVYPGGPAVLLRQT